MTNEFLVLTSCYFIFIYSNGFLLMTNPGWPEYDEQITDIKSKFLVGWFNVGLLGLLISINLVVMLTV